MIDPQFLVISPKINTGLIKTTVNSIKFRYKNPRIYCSTHQSAIKDDIDFIKNLCPVVRGQDTITSLINSGMRKMKKDWVIWVMEGSIIKSPFHFKYENWLNDENDVFYPLSLQHNRHGKPVNITTCFENSSLNGIMFHKQIFNKVGKFSDNPLEISRKIWREDAQDNGALFKGVLGIRL